MSRFRNEVVPVIGIVTYAAFYWCKPVRNWFEKHGY